MGNNNFHRRNNFPTGNIENSIGFSKKSNVKYFLKEIDSDRQYSNRKLRFHIGFFKIPIGSSFISVGKSKYP